jgi:outer membrane lipoprotein-sorting protein
LLCQNFAANGRDEGFAMKLQGTGPWAATPVTNIPHCRTGLFVLLFLVMATLSQSAGSQTIQAVPVENTAPLTAEQVMRNLAQMNLHRVEALHAYEGTGTYRAEYDGFPGRRKAEMIVNLTYLSPGKIEFAIQSATGSKLIIDRVFKKLLEAEKEESSPKIERRSALTDANYRFTLIGENSGLSGPAYVLEVQPRRKDKFLYHGRIWVDAGDFAVVRLEAKPSQNLSFWTRRADIVEVYTKVSDFWLPAHNHSVAAIRLGGHAELTIDYKDYEITDASEVSGLEAPQSVPQAATDHALE